MSPYMYMYMHSVQIACKHSPMYTPSHPHTLTPSQLERDIQRFPIIRERYSAEEDEEQPEVRGRVLLVLTVCVMCSCSRASSCLHDHTILLCVTCSYTSHPPHTLTVCDLLVHFPPPTHLPTHTHPHSLCMHTLTPSQPVVVQIHTPSQPHTLTRSHPHSRWWCRQLTTTMV